MQIIQSVLHPWSIQAANNRSFSIKEKAVVLALTILSSLASACITIRALPVIATLSFYTWTWMVKKQDSNNQSAWQTYKNNYQLESTIEKIKELKLQSKKIHLLIGRSASEPLPKATKDAIWVSLDAAVVHLFVAQAPTFDPSRLHLQIDFNNHVQMQKIANLFHEVIVDYSYPFTGVAA